MITSIFINGTLPVVDGMKNLNDFIISNWFEDFPALSAATPYAGYHFGQYVTDINNNSFNSENPATVSGSLNNSNGYISVNVDNYLDTNEKAALNLTVGGCFKRPEVPSGSLFFISDFTGTGSDAIGFAIGVSAAGKLRAAAQNAGVAQTSIADVDFPSSIAVGDYCAFTAFIRNGMVTIAVYNPVTQQYDSTAVGLSGDRAAGTKNVLIGRKQDNNATSLSCDVRSVVLINGGLSTAEHVAVQQYLLNMV
ncbi:hypothetical protein [Klebsiella michiganensis]|uniref:hypothetical protein n=1 Tax=Klebsiella michiganensis TaxID=1134687 RepID=UPI001E3F3D7C|nr:hypothetical protein [Klebsiella michiganensis]